MSRDKEEPDMLLLSFSILVVGANVFVVVFFPANRSVFTSEYSSFFSIGSLAIRNNSCFFMQEIH